MHDFKRRLVDLGINPENMKSDLRNTPEDQEILKIAITSGLVENISQST